MAAVKGAGPIRWTKGEYSAVEQNVSVQVKAGKNLTEAIERAQAVLPKHRRHSRQTLQTGAIQDSMRRRLIASGMQAKSLTSQGKPINGTRAVWTPLEWALVARRVKYQRDTMKDKRIVARIIVAAAEIELPPERQRPLTSIWAGTTTRNEKAIVEGIKNAKLIASFPFEPNRTTYGVAEPVAPAPAKAPRMVFEFVDESKLPKPDTEAPARPQAATKPAAPTTSPATAPSAPEGLTFTVTAGPAVVELLRVMVTQAVANELEARLPISLARITSQLQVSIASMLTNFLDAKPGDAVQAPPEHVEAPAPAAKHVEAKLPLCDVVGLIGPQINQVRDTLNGHAKSVRFIEADFVGSWTPRGVVIMNTKFVSHNAENKCKKAGVKPIRVSGGAEAVLRALGELYQQSSTVAAEAH